MENYIIAAVIVFAVAVGAVSAVKHFRGQSGCCGGGGYKPRKKKLSNVIYTKTFKVEGMHCDHCKARIEEVVGDIKGVAGKVDLKKGEVIVSYAERVSDRLIKGRIEKAGYTVTEIK